NELLNIQDYDRRELHNHIPITSLDEIGVLTSSYNKIQNKIEKIYKDIDEDLDFAKKVHNHLIPELNYKDDSLAIQAISKPVRDIGGDFYDFVQVEQNKYIVLIGDVLGKGLPASLLMSMIIGHFRASAKVDSTATE